MSQGYRRGVYLSHIHYSTTVKFFSLHTPASQEVGFRAQSQPQYGAPEQRGFKGLIKRPYSDSLAVLALEPRLSFQENGTLTTESPLPHAWTDVRHMILTITKMERMYSSPESQLFKTNKRKHAAKKLRVTLYTMAPPPCFTVFSG